MKYPEKSDLRPACRPYLGKSHPDPPQSAVLCPWGHSRRHRRSYRSHPPHQAAGKLIDQYSLLLQCLVIGINDRQTENGQIVLYHVK